MIATTPQADPIRSELATDLTIAFKLFGSEAMDVIKKAEVDGWTIQHLEQALMRI